jgi:hypothetical protein
MPEDLYTVESYAHGIGGYPLLVDSEGNVVYLGHSEAHHKLRETEQTFTNLGEQVPALRVKALSIN